MNIAVYCNIEGDPVDPVGGGGLRGGGGGEGIKAKALHILGS